eukprot:TRINITY_DN5839_c0_g2_i1.p1 TRINITY_DN5839_c0_g2~~TRINITY_DN5839_c0_g2_i1.p1  ORF type:complete len:463 (+),score=166.97 TRINITY_DN5839_c0_g2_i1:74-1462(+)
MHASRPRRAFKLPAVPHAGVPGVPARELVDPDSYIPPLPVVPDPTELGEMGLSIAPLGTPRGIGALPATMPSTLPAAPRPHRVAALPRGSTYSLKSDGGRPTGTMKKALETQLERERLRGAIAQYSPTVVFRECLAIFSANQATYGPLWKLMQDEHQRVLAEELNRDTRVGDMKGTLWGALTAAQTVYQDEVLQARMGAELKRHVKVMEAEREERERVYSALRGAHAELGEKHKVLQTQCDDTLGSLKALQQDHSKKVHEMSKLEGRCSQLQAVLDAYGEADEGKLGLKMLAALQKAEFKQDQVAQLKKDQANAAVELKHMAEEFRRSELQVEHYRKQWEEREGTVVTLTDRIALLEEDLSRAQRAINQPGSPSSTRRASHALARPSSFSQLAEVIGAGVRKPSHPVSPPPHHRRASARRASNAMPASPRHNSPRRQSHMHFPAPPGDNRRQSSQRKSLAGY